MATEIEELSVAITADTSPFRAAMRDLGNDADRFSRAITRAFKDAVVGGKGFEDVLKSLALRLAEITLDRALQPIGSGIANALTGLLGGLTSVQPFANGGVMAAGVRPFAAGGLVASPTFFPTSGGVGLAGEAGPEAILPLARSSDGRLGVKADGARTISVTLNVITPDAETFRKSEAQLTSMLARAVGRGRRGL